MCWKYSGANRISRWNGQCWWAWWYQLLVPPLNVYFLYLAIFLAVGGTDWMIRISKEKFWWRKIRNSFNCIWLNTCTIKWVSAHWVGMVPIRHFLGERLNHQMKKIRCFGQNHQIYCPPNLPTIWYTLARYAAWSYRIQIETFFPMKMQVAFNSLYFWA